MNSDTPWTDERQATGTCDGWACCRELERENTELKEALIQVFRIGEEGVIERRETGKPTWHALDAIKTIAMTAIEKAEGGSR